MSQGKQEEKTNEWPSRSKPHTDKKGPPGGRQAIPDAREMKMQKTNQKKAPGSQGRTPPYDCINAEKSINRNTFNLRGKVHLKFWICATNKPGGKEDKQLRARCKSKISVGGIEFLSAVEKKKSTVDMISWRTSAGVARVGRN